MVSFYIIAAAIFVCTSGVAVYIAIGERRYGHASDDTQNS